MNAVLPGSVVGVLGSGQLGRMFAIAARRMGYRVHTFSPLADTPAGQVSDREYRHPYEDLDAVREFARGVRVVTFEFENVPSDSVHAIDGLVPVRPSGEALYIAQQRGRLIEAAFRRFGDHFAVRRHRNAVVLRVGEKVPHAPLLFRVDERPAVKIGMRRTDAQRVKRVIGQSAGPHQLPQRIDQIPRIPAAERLVDLGKE